MPSRGKRALASGVGLGAAARHRNRDDVLEHPAFDLDVGEGDLDAEGRAHVVGGYHLFGGAEEVGAFASAIFMACIG